jgi:hypothetical protein
MNKLNQATLTEKDQQEVMQAIAVIRQKLPFLVNLSKDERRTLPKLGDKTRIFVQKAMEVVDQNDNFLPRSFDVPNMRREVNLYEGLYPILLSLAQLHELVEDTYMSAGNEAYASAREVYSAAKSHGRGIGIDAVVEELGTRFSRKSRKPQPQIPAKVQA